MRIYDFDAVVIGSGCAGYNCADWLYDLGYRNVLYAEIVEPISRVVTRAARADNYRFKFKILHIFSKKSKL